MKMEMIDSSACCLVCSHLLRANSWQNPGKLLLVVLTGVLNGFQEQHGGRLSHQLL
jgi:hypothetical protein